MPKRKNECSAEKIERKLKKYNDLLQNMKRRRRRSRTRSPSPSPVPPDSDLLLGSIEDLTQKEPIQDENSNSGENKVQEGKCS